MGGTLLVAPLINEDYGHSEISALVNILEAELLLGADATSRNLLDKLSSEEWEIIWFIGHGSNTGMMLHDGKIDSGALTSFIRNANPGLVVFNTCSSFGVASDIQNEVATNFICTISDIDDRTAFFTGKQLAQNIANGYSYQDSFHRSKSGQNRNYVYLAGTKDMPSRGDQDAYAKQADLLDLQEEISAISTDIYGGKGWNQSGLLGTVREIEMEVQKIKTVSETSRPIMFALIAINLMILTALILFALQPQL